MRLLTLFILLLATPVHAEDGFARWLADFRSEAARAEIPESVLADALDGLSENETVVRLDRKQPEKTTRFSDYLKNVVNDRRIEEGRALIAEHKELLDEISAHYGVPAEYIVALWGIETNYGGYTGSFSVIEALATLAYEGRRAEFFRKELLHALRILAQENMTSDTMIGSWAGAMGQCQFMPSTYISYAVDWDKDGHRDIWNSLPDTFASIANYLHSLGWDKRAGWGAKAQVPADFTQAEADIKRARPLHSWRDRGVTVSNVSAIADDQRLVYVIYPGQPEEGAYMITSNYQALLQWNRSRYFATAVGTLADAIKE
jgi:membrane-bound lytic murein transglycosylase B